jgi:hypothetical protein
MNRHEFHFFNLVIEIKFIFHNILIYWDAPLYIIYHFSREQLFSFTLVTGDLQAILDVISNGGNEDGDTLWTYV